MLPTSWIADRSISMSGRGSAESPQQDLKEAKTIGNGNRIRIRPLPCPVIWSWRPAMGPPSASSTKVETGDKCRRSVRRTEWPRSRRSDSSARRTLRSLMSRTFARSAVVFPAGHASPSLAAFPAEPTCPSRLDRDRPNRAHRVLRSNSKSAPPSPRIVTPEKPRRLFRALSSGLTTTSRYPMRRSTASPISRSAHLADHDQAGGRGLGGGQPRNLPQVNQGEEGPVPGDHLLSLGLLDLLRADFEDLLDRRDGEGVPLVADRDQENRHHH